MVQSQEVILLNFFVMVMDLQYFFMYSKYVMVLGLLPIVGSPLPIMSYGGSSMLATMIGFAIVMSAKINHKQQ